MFNKYEHDELLMGHEIFQGLSREQMTWLLQVTQHLEVRRGDVLFEQGQAVDRLYIVLSGHMQLMMSMPDAQEKVVDFLQPGDVLGESAMIPQACSLVSARALSAGQLIEIEQEKMALVVERVPSLSMQLLAKLAQRIQSQLDALESTAFKNAVQRVAEYVLRQQRSGAQTRLLYRKRSIASKLGLQPETFSRSLKQLATQGFISVQGANITIHDEAGLQALLL